MKARVLNVYEPKASKTGNIGFTAKMSVMERSELSISANLRKGKDFLVYFKGSDNENISRMDYVQLSGNWAPQRDSNIRMLFADSVSVLYDEEYISSYLSYIGLMFSKRQEIMKLDYEDILKYLDGIPTNDNEKLAFSLHRDNLNHELKDKLQSLDISDEGVNTLVTVAENLGLGFSDLVRDPYAVAEYKYFFNGGLTFNDLSKLVGEETIENMINKIKACVIDTVVSQERGDRQYFSHGVSQGSFVEFGRLNAIVQKRLGVIDKALVKEAYRQLELTEEIALQKLGEHFVVYSGSAYRSEKKIAESMRYFSKNTKFFHRREEKDVLKAIDDFESAKDIKLDEVQKDAIVSVFSNQFSVITGGPGTGKSTIIDCINYVSIFNDTILSAPTGKAANRMREISRMPAKTVHSTYDINPFGIAKTQDILDTVYNFNTNRNPDVESEYLRKLLSYGDDLVELSEKVSGLESIVTMLKSVRAEEYKGLHIIDEVSMLSLPLLADVLSRITSVPEAGLVLIGDPDQLASIDPGRILLDLLDTDVPVTRLKHVYRQDKGNLILDNAEKIRNNDTDLEFDVSSFINIPVYDTKEAINIAVTNYFSKVKTHGFEEVALLTPYSSDKISISSTSLNKVISKLIVDTKKLSSLEYYGRYVFEGAKIVKLSNDLDNNVANGDIGDVKSIYTDPDGVKQVTIEFESLLGQSVIYEIPWDKDFFKEYDLAYALSIHKSQGSEYKEVIMVLPEARDTSKFSFIQKSLMYTGITRASQTVTFIGDIKVLEYAIKTEDYMLSCRPTTLSQKIKEELAK